MFEQGLLVLVGLLILAAGLAATGGDTGGTAQTGGETGSNANAGNQGGQTAGQNNAGMGQTAGQGNQNAGGQAAGQNTQAGGEQAQERKFTQAELDRIVQERLAEEKRRGSRTTEQRIADLEAQLAQSKLEALRATVANRHNLPPALAGRLRGSTETELEADAKELSKLVPAAQGRGGGADGGAGGNNATPSTMNDFIRRAAGRR